MPITAIYIHFSCLMTKWTRLAIRLAVSTDIITLL